MTPAQVRRRMSARDLIEWREFEEEFGPVTLHERIDAAAQLIAYTVHASSGGDLPAEKFRMKWKRSGGATPEQFFHLLGNVAKKGAA